MYRVLLVAAVHNELRGLLANLQAKDNSFTWRQLHIDAVVCGIGAVNAAAVVAVQLQKFRYDHVWMVGSCGGYSAGKGDVVIATQEINADLGIAQQGMWTSPSAFPFSIVENENGTYVNTFPCCAYEIDAKFSFAVHKGILLSTSCVSGDAKRATVMEKRFGAIAENMEGAAVAQVCALNGIKFTEVRGVSNVAGERNKEYWDFPTAWRNTHTLTIHLWEKI